MVSPDLTHHPTILFQHWLAWGRLQRILAAQFTEVTAQEGLLNFIGVVLLVPRALGERVTKTVSSSEEDGEGRMLFEWIGEGN